MSLSPQVVAKISQVVALLAERAKKPGVMSLAGARAERAMRRDLASYFVKLETSLGSLSVSSIGDSTHDAAIARHAAEMSARQAVRRNQDSLRVILETNYAEAMITADKQDVMHEANPFDPDELSKVGLTAQQAADYAAEHAGEQITGIDQTTVDTIAETVEQAILDQIGPKGLSQNLRAMFDDFTKDRADTIARTEMADAFARSAEMKLDRLGIDYGQIINSPNACEECVELADMGPQPMSDLIGVLPVHPNCRCALVGARGPNE